jgi:peptide/nickel transport system ATP-binding protein/oligopeptide transport system ATP-binding protein
MVCGIFWTRTPPKKYEPPVSGETATRIDPMNVSLPLLTVADLKTYFFTHDGVAKAVDGVSLAIKPGEIMGIVGESGSGKSVMALSIMRLIPNPPGKIIAGRIHLHDTDLLSLPEAQMQDIRGNRVSMIFQEPMTSLNPLFSVGDQISEMFLRHRGAGKKEAWERSVAMLESVQIPSPSKRAKEYPHQLSGGMRQRVMIAMALACNPELLIADEPTTALDVTIQAQVIDLMLQLQSRYNAAIMMITHDLGVIAEIAQRVVVMYAGQVVETGDIYAIFESPLHPYTEALLRSIPKIGSRSRKGRTRLEEIEGIVPSLYHLPRGCSFFPRCRKAMPECQDNPVALTDQGNDRQVRCLLHQT